MRDTPSSSPRYPSALTRSSTFLSAAPISSPEMQVPAGERHPLWTLLFLLLDLPKEPLEMLDQPLNVVLPRRTALPPL